MATRKAPTGPKHDRCIGHVEHPYPAKGVLCFGEVIGEDGMIAFADHLATVRAEHRAVRSTVPAQPETWTTGSGKARRLRPIGKDEHGRTIVPAVCIGNGADGGCHAFSVHAHPAFGTVQSMRDDTGLGELVARYRAMRGLPATDAPVKAAPVRKARSVEVTPVVAETPAPVAPEPAGSGIGSICEHGAYADLCISCHPEPISIETPVEPAADTYAAAVELAELRPDPCEACGHPAHGATCASCDDAAQVGTYAPCAFVAPVQAPVEPIAEPAPVLSAPAPVSAPAERPTCPRCGKSFRVKGSGLAWHVANRPDCVRVAVAV